MAEPIAALIVRILADTAEMVTGVKQVTGQLDTLENRVMKVGKGIAAGFTVGAITAFATSIINDAGQIDSAAKRVGAGAEEFQRFAFGVRQSGIDMGAAEQNIASLNERLGSDNAGLLNVLRKLNLSTDEFRSKDPIQRYVDLGVAISGIVDPAERAAMRVEALGAKGEKALAAIDKAFEEQAKNAPIYSAQDIEALDAVGRAMERLEGKAKAAAASIALAIGRATMSGVKGIFGAPTSDVGGSFGDAKVGGYDPRFVGPGLDQAPVPGSPLTPPGQLPALGGIDPNDAKALAVALSELTLKYVQVKISQDEAREAAAELSRQFYLNRDAAAALLSTFKTEFPKDNFIERLITHSENAVGRIAALRSEAERLLEIISPGSTKIAGDDVDEQIRALRANPLNWIGSGRDKGNLTPQALEEEMEILNVANLRYSAGLMQARNLVPVSTNSSGFSSVVNRVPTGTNFGSVVNPAPANITINAQGSYWRDPQMMNELGRLFEDAVAGRGTGAYSRR